MNVPELRFPEFVEDWEVKKLGDILEPTNERTSINNEYEIISSTKKGLYLQSEYFNKNIASENNIGYKILRLNEIVFSPQNLWLGNINFNKKYNIGIVSPSYKIFKTNQNSLYIGIFLKLNRMIFRYGLISEQGASVVRRNLNINEFNELKIKIPSIPEQKKISNFFTVIDNLIDLLTRQKENLEIYKKGVMQKIFSREIRFKDDDGNDYPDWEVKKLGEICDIKGGKRIPKGYNLQEKDNGLPYITVSDMNNGNVSFDKIKFVPLEIYRKIKNYTISTNDLYVSVAGTLGLVGMIPENLNNANLTENANKLTNINCIKKYLYFYLNTNYFSKLINSVKTNNAQPKLAIYALKNFKIKLASLPEQQKIANLLSNIDNQIETVSNHLENTHQYKKSLLQKMFI